MEGGVQQFKYIIIDRETHDVVVKVSFREIADFINTVGDDKLSHNTVGKRLAVDNHFLFNNLIIKALVW